jgi:hypothetical protein
MKIPIILFVLWIPLNVLAQKSSFVPGYIVTNKGDTISGFLKTESLNASGKVAFKRYMKGTPGQYGPLQIRSFLSGYGQYVSKAVDGKKGLIYRDEGNYRPLTLKKKERRFLKVVVSGDLNLYELEYVDLNIKIRPPIFLGPTISSEEITYIFRFLQRNSEDSVFNIQCEDLNHELVDYFAPDAGDIVAKISQDNAPRERLAEYVKDYNLLKYVPSPPKSRKTALIVFYKRPNRRSAGLSLVINDTLTYTVPEKYLGSFNIPVDTRTKVCYGSETSKVCDLISGIARYPFPEYYELGSNDGKDSFLIEKKEPLEAQQNLLQVVRE